MSLSAYLWRDLIELRQSRTGVALGAVFVLLAGGFTAAYLSTGSMTPVYAVLFFGSPFLFPAIGLSVTVLSLAQHRESGSMRVLLTVPGRRWALVVATFLSRSIAVLAGFALIAVVVVLLESFGAGSRQFGFGLVSLSSLLTLSTVGVGVLISTIATTQRHALFVTVAYYTVAVVGWSVFFPQSPDQLLQATTGGAITTSTTQSILVAAPGNAYLVLFQLLGTDSGFVTTIGSLFGTPTPSATSGLISLLSWVAVPVVVATGYLEQVEIR